MGADFIGERLEVMFDRSQTRRKEGKRIVTLVRQSITEGRQPLGGLGFLLAHPSDFAAELPCDA